MAKFFGEIGFVTTVETVPGVWQPQLVKRNYYGDIIRNTSRWSAMQSGGAIDKVNDDITVSNEISIVADPYAYENFHNIIYVEYMGTKWKVSSVNVQQPRLNLSLGGVYNGDQT